MIRARPIVCFFPPDWMKMNAGRCLWAASKAGRRQQLLFFFMISIFFFKFNLTDCLRAQNPASPLPHPVTPNNHKTTP